MTTGKKVQIALVLVFILSICGVALLFVQTAFQKAEHKDFWGDEEYGLYGTVTAKSYLELVKSGANGQTSPAPLDYIGLKILHQLRDPVGSLGLPFNIYYRLNSIMYSLFSGLLVVSFLFRDFLARIRSVLALFLQGAGLVGALSIYYFWYYNLHFSVETRPYALWNSLWFMILALYMHFGKINRMILALIFLLAFTATGAIFQLFCLGSCLVLVRWLDGEKFGTVFGKTLARLIFPAGICMYYLTYMSASSLTDNSAHGSEFFRFWLTKEMIPILSLCGIAMSLPIKKFHSHTIVFGTMLALYLISPFINYLTMKNNYFFSSRQYLYYDLIYPLFFIHCARMVPVVVEYCERLLHSRKNLMLPQGEG